MSAELFGKKANLRYSKSVLCCYHRTWFVNPRSVIFPRTVHRIILHEEGILSSGYKLDKSVIDTLKRFLCKRLFPEDGSSFIREIKYILYRLPLLQPRKHILPTTLTVGRFREYYRQTLFSKDAEEAFPCGVGTKVGSVQDAVLKVVTVLLDIAHPLLIKPAFVHADRLPFFVHISPAHKLFHILNLNVVRIYNINITEEMFCQRPAISISRLTAFSFREVGTLQRSMKHYHRIRI